LIVEYDGHNIIVQVSPFYRNKLCGLCGNYNGLKYDGATTAEGCYYEDGTAYAYAYAIPSDTCEVPKFELKCPNEGGQKKTDCTCRSGIMHGGMWRHSALAIVESGTEACGGVPHLP
ncbi:hypothetical protein AVEN_61384-1, partial [Araneus ventricosus]